MQKWGEAVAPTAALIPKSASAPPLVSLLFLLPKPAQASRWVRGLDQKGSRGRSGLCMCHVAAVSIFGVAGAVSSCCPGVRGVASSHDPHGMCRDYENFVHEELLSPNPSGHPSVHYTAKPGPSTILLSVRPPVFQVA